MNRGYEHERGLKLIAERWTSFQVVSSRMFICRTPDSRATQVSIDTISPSRTRKARLSMNDSTAADRQPIILSMSCNGILTVTSTTSREIDIRLPVLRLEFGVRR